MWNIKQSPFYTKPHEFLKEGDRVRAKCRVFEDPAAADELDPSEPPVTFPDRGYIHAEPGELGTVIFVEEGFWPTVRFDRSGTATCVTDFEVEAWHDPVLCHEEPCAKCGVSLGMLQ